jgi:hypothetical protein
MFYVVVLHSFSKSNMITIFCFNFLSRYYLLPQDVYDNSREEDLVFEVLIKWKVILDYR